MLDGTGHSCSAISLVRHAESRGVGLPPVYVGMGGGNGDSDDADELNENLREIYIEAYTQKEAAAYIFRRQLRSFIGLGAYQPELTAEDFTIWRSGRRASCGHMAQPCDETFTPKKAGVLSDDESARLQGRGGAFAAGAGVHQRLADPRDLGKLRDELFSLWLCGLRSHL